MTDLPSRRSLGSSFFLVARGSAVWYSPLLIEGGDHLMKRFKPLLLLPIILSLCGRSAQAQDNVRDGSEPIMRSVDPAKLTYDYLVDGNLPQDDPAAKKFKTLQAA